jgi:hypothetical protein
VHRRLVINRGRVNGHIFLLGYSESMLRAATVYLESVVE